MRLFIFIIMVSSLFIQTPANYVYRVPTTLTTTTTTTTTAAAAAAIATSLTTIALAATNLTQNEADDVMHLRKECPNKCYCGTPSINRIVGGNIVKQNKYPWTAQLVKGRYYPRLFCGGSLINNRYVLTAAHCVKNNRQDQITVRLLQLDRSSNDVGITRQVSKIIIHPQYDEHRIINDLALLELNKAIPWDSGIRPICLPALNQNFEGQKAIVAGWGLVKEGGVTSNYLQEVTVPILTNRECQNTRYKNKIQDVMLCAGYVKQGGKDACQGDSGGPLIVKEDRFKLAGVVSFGFGCAQPNAPGVYTRVSKFINWIYTETSNSCYC